MANRNVFTSYKRLEEALESILADESNDEEYDMVLVPPDPAVVSDEEEGNEDNLAASSFPMDVPGTIEVGRRRPDYDVSEKSDSDDEPLRPMPAKRAKKCDVDLPVWRKTQPTYSSTYEITDIVQKRQKYVVESLADCNPVMLFEKIFDHDVMDLITTNSVLYANQNNRHGFELDSACLKNFLVY